jgi:hypothetical protein
MIIFKIKCNYLLYIYVTAFLVANISNLFGVICHLFKYIDYQYLSNLAHDLLSQVICGLHGEKFGDPCFRVTGRSAISYLVHNPSVMAAI